MLPGRRSFGGLVVVASALLVQAAGGSSPIQVPATASKTLQFATTKDAFETDGLMDQREVVLVQPMVESRPTSVLLGVIRRFTSCGAQR
jgi:hypothetical protein